jgi:hypothetical protein
LYAKHAYHVSLFERLHTGTALLAAFLLSWANNILATSLISYKTWSHHRAVKRDLRRSMLATGSELTSILFIAGGVLYVFLWVSNGTTLLNKFDL